MRLVVVGASLAGLRAAQGARAAGFGGEVVVIGEEQHMPYTRPPLSKDVLAGVDHISSTPFPCDELDVEWRLGATATGLDVDGHAVLLDGGERLDYDRLVLATGCRARRWAGPGAELDGLHTLRHLDDALALQRELADRSPRVAVVGAGFIGSEVAASLRKLGLEATLIDIAPLPMPALGELIGQRTAELHGRNGVGLHLGTGIAALHGDADGRVAEVELATGERIACELAVIALGAIPNTEWLAGSGLTLEPGVVCDEQLAAVGAEDVWAAGDIAAWPHPLAGGERIRVEHWTNAAEQGTLAGRNAVADPADRRPYVAVPSFWSDQYDVKIQAVGLPRQAEAMRIVETTPEGDRFVAVGERDGRAVAALGWNGARRLPWYRRRLADGVTPDELAAEVAQDPKAFGAAVTA